MPQYRCNVCQGTYLDPQADGLSYYHLCPPVTLVSVERSGNALQVPLADLQPTDQIHVRRGPVIVQIPAVAQLEGDVRLNDGAAPRALARNENIAVHDADGTPVPKAETLGRTPI